MQDEVIFILLYFFSFAFIGWIIESSYRSITEKAIINSGFLYGPFIPIYGFGAIFVFQIYQIFHAFPLIGKILICTLVLTIFEYLTSYIMEKIFHIRLWDYSNEILNIKGRICFKCSFFWTILASLQIIYIQSFVINIIDSIPLSVQIGIAGPLIVYFCIDFILSSKLYIYFSKGFIYLMNMDTSVKLPHLTLNSGLTKKINNFLRPFRQFPFLKKQLHGKVSVFPKFLKVLHDWVNTYSTIYSDNYKQDKEFQSLIIDIIKHPEYQKLKEFHHHEHSIYNHSIHVAWLSYKFAKKLNIMVRETVRGALFHDLFFYCWRDKENSPKLHAIRHPREAYINAVEHFGPLSAIEKDIIIKHMWPLTVIPPKYPESFVVCLIDKVVAIKEFGVEAIMKLNTITIKDFFKKDKD